MKNESEGDCINCGASKYDRTFNGNAEFCKICHIEAPGTRSVSTKIQTITKIVNLRLEKCDVKCCRTPKNEILAVPHPSCLGNPFAVQTYGRDKCIAMYKPYFYNRIATEPDFVEYVKSLKGKTLGCFCKQPNVEVDCHVDIIKEYLDELDS